MLSLGSRTLAGLILIILGLGLFALQLVTGLGDAIVLFIIGSLFIVGYLRWAKYGLLIPGSLILGVGLGRVGSIGGYATGDTEGIGLGAGFLGIYLIDTVYRGRTHWWPLAPGSIILLTGIARVSEDTQRLVGVIWPIGLIIVGLALLAGSLGFGRRIA